MSADADIEAAAEVVRAGLVEVIEAADPDRLVRIAAFIENIENPEPIDLMTVVREEARRRR
jgi:hypothetical protein